MTRAWSEYEGLKTVVTGAASGMGAETTRLLIEGGARVYALDLKPVEAEGVASSIICNLLDQSSIDAAIESIGGDVDAIFSCAGMPTGCSWEDTLTVNFFAPRYFIEKMLPKMKKGGAVATIASLTLGWERQFATINEASSARRRSSSARFCWRTAWANPASERVRPATRAAPMATPAATPTR